MSRVEKFNPETIAALDTLENVFWQAAVAEVEQEMAKEVPLKATRRVLLIRRASNTTQSPVAALSAQISQ